MLHRHTALYTIQDHQNNLQDHQNDLQDHQNDLQDHQNDLQDHQTLLTLLSRQQLKPASGPPGQVRDVREHLQHYFKNDFKRT